jgi:hypothetical protein
VLINVANSMGRVAYVERERMIIKMRCCGSERRRPYPVSMDSLT